MLRVTNYIGIWVIAAIAIDPSEGYHKYFERVVVDHSYEAPSMVTVDGSVIPNRFALHFEDVRFPIAESEPMEFVLVLPTSVDIDGVTLYVDTPYYISTTELSNGQYSQLRTSGLSYEEATMERYMSARFDTRLLGSDLDFIEKYLSNPRLPAIGMRLDDIAGVTRNLERSFRMTVRVPTIAEWFVAMRAGQATRYWWGDEIGPEHVPSWSERHDRLDCAKLSELVEVDAGETNPLGLMNVLGNAAEFVVPSEKERKVLRDRFGPLATKANDGREMQPGFLLGSMGGLSLGGSVFNSGGAANLDLCDLLSTWEGIIVWSQVDELEWCHHIHSGTGVRLAIEIPPGEWTIECGETVDGDK